MPPTCSPGVVVVVVVVVSVVVVVVVSSVDSIFETVDALVVVVACVALFFALSEASIVKVIAPLKSKALTVYFAL